jgi:hypothetical protein
VRPVRGAERVVDVGVGERGEAARELGIVCLLPGMEAEVLEQEDLARGEALRGLLGLRPDAVVHETDRRLQELGEPYGNRGERELGLALALRLAQMRGADHAGAARDREPYRRQRLDDARVVGHATLRERDVEIDAEKQPAARQIHFADRFHRPGRIAR